MTMAGQLAHKIIEGEGGHHAGTLAQHPDPNRTRGRKNPPRSGSSNERKCSP